MTTTRHKDLRQRIVFSDGACSAAPVVRQHENEEQHVNSTLKTGRRWTEQSVFEKLDALFPAPAWIMLRQVANSTGDRVCQFADVLAVSCWPSRGVYAVGIEIKVSPGDLKKELGKHWKSSPIQRFCKHWYLAMPEALYDGSFLLPETWGLITVNRTARIAVEAPTLEAAPPTMDFMASVFRNLSRSTIPKDEVEKMVEERVQSRVKFQTDSANSRVRQIENTLAIFADASGIDLRKTNEWELGDVGAAVKMIRESGNRQLSAIAQRIAKDAERFSMHANDLKVRAAALAAETKTFDEKEMTP